MMFRKLQILVGGTALLLGVGLAGAAPASADTTPPTVRFDQGLHFVKGSSLSDSTTRAKLNVSEKWTQSDSDGICAESGYAYDEWSGSYSNWSGIRTQYAFLATAGYQTEFYISVADCAGNSTSYYNYPSWTLNQENTASFNGTWRTSTCGCWSESTDMYSTQIGASASFVANAHNFGLVTARATNRGTADVYFDGVLKAHINEYSSVTKNRVVDFSAYTPVTGYHTVRVVVRSGRIDIDAFVTS